MSRLTSVISPKKKRAYSSVKRRTTPAVSSQRGGYVTIPPTARMEQTLKAVPSVKSTTKLLTDSAKEIAPAQKENPVKAPVPEQTAPQPVLFEEEEVVMPIDGSEDEAEEECVDVEVFFNESSEEDEEPEAEVLETEEVAEAAEGSEVEESLVTKEIEVVQGEIVDRDEIENIESIEEIVPADLFQDHRDLELEWANYTRKRKSIADWLVPIDSEPQLGTYTLTVRNDRFVIKVTREIKPVEANYEEKFEEYVPDLSKEEYIAELDKLLSFMTSWDRTLTVDKYKALVFSSQDAVRVMTELGSPQKLAVGLAQNYVPTPNPYDGKPHPQEEERKPVSKAKEPEEKTFRSVAASYHSGEDSEKKDSALTFYVDMCEEEEEEEEIPEEDPRTVADPEVTRKSEKTDRSKSNHKKEVNKKAKPRAKSPVLFMLGAIPLMAVVNVVMLALIVALLFFSVLLIAIPINSIMTLPAGVQLGDMVFLAGMLLAVMPICMALVVMGIKGYIRTFKGMLNWITSSIEGAEDKEDTQ